MAIKKVKKLTKKEINEGNKLIAKFNDFDYLICDVKISELPYHKDWEWLMPIVDKIETMGAHMEIRGHGCHMFWWYSPKKYVHFQGGQNKWNKWKELRKSAFDSIGGKHHRSDVGVGESAEKVSMETKILAVWYNTVGFIKWYNENVKKNNEFNK